MVRPIRFLLVGVVLALSSFIGASAAAAQALPPSLQGEVFLVGEHPLDPLGPNEDIEITAACPVSASNPFELTATLTLTYTARGIALGPYPGFFTETGTVKALLTSTSNLIFSGIVTEWKASFTIDSFVRGATVTGEKTLTPLGTFVNPATCRNSVFESEEASAHLAYEATITTATGTFTDRGRSLALVREDCPIPCTGPFEAEVFLEEFYLSTGVLPVDTSGKATGGGEVVSGSDPFDRVTFGFNVRRDENETRLNGTCNVLDHASGTHVKCLTVTDYQQIGNTATWEGTAEVNGDREHYRITVQDNGEPNQGIDMFSIKTVSYEAAGNVQHGNVQLHKQPLGL